MFRKGEKMAEKKKTIFDRAIDAVSNRDEKAAAEAARLEAEKAKQEAAALRTKLAAQKASEDMKAKAFARNQAEKAAAEKAAAKPVVKYVLKEGDTWTHVSLKFYGHTTEPYWRPIYEANKEIVGDDYRRIRPGMEIIIPELPDELKGK
jgi:nucleoid-associated protein YgaU